MVIKSEEKEFKCYGYVTKPISYLSANNEEGIYNIDISYYKNEHATFYNKRTSDKHFKNTNFDLFSKSLNKWLSFDEANKCVFDYQYFRLLEFTYIRMKIKE